MPLADDLGIKDVEEVVRDLFGLDYTSSSPDELRIFCPIHEKGGDHSPSADVNLKTGQWNCWACSGSGDIVGLGKLVLGMPRHKVTSLLRPNEPSEIAASMKSRLSRKMAVMESASTPKKAEKSLELPPLGSYSDGPMNEMTRRGLTKKTLRHWGVRYAERAVLTKTDGDTFEIRNNIAIPILDHQGELLCWCYRSTPDSDPWQSKGAKYVYTPGLVNVLSKTWFGLWENRHEEDIAVVEGALDAIWCWQNQIPAVAMLGASTKQFLKTEALTDFRSVTILPDRDQAGMTAALLLGDQLQKFGTPVKIALYREWMTRRDGTPAEDPQDLCPLDLELFWWTAQPWLAWRSRPNVRRLARKIQGEDKGKDAARSLRS